MSNNKKNNKALDSLKKILLMNSQYNYTDHYMSPDFIENNVNNYYKDLEENKISREKLTTMLDNIAKELNVDLNDNFFKGQFKAIDSSLDNSNLDDFIKSIHTKLEFVESIAFQNENSKKQENVIEQENVKADDILENKNESNSNEKEDLEQEINEDNINIDTPKRDIKVLRNVAAHSKEFYESTKFFMAKQKDKVINFFADKVNIKNIGKKLIHKFSIKEKEADNSTLLLAHLNAIREIRAMGIEITCDTYKDIGTDSFDIKNIIEESKNTKDKETTKENEKVKEEQDITIVDEDNIRVYKKDSNGKCYSALSYKGKAWNNSYKEVPIEEYNTVVEKRLSKEYESISNIVKNQKGDILGVSEKFILSQDYENGAVDNGKFYTKDIDGKYYMGLNYKGKPWGEKLISKEEYEKALSERLSLNNDTFKDYLKDGNLDEVVNKFNKDQIEKEEAKAKEEVNVEKETDVNNKNESKVESKEVEQDIDSNVHTPDSFTISNGSIVFTYFKNEKGEMCSQTNFNGMKGSVKVIKDAAEWNDKFKQSNEYVNSINKDLDNSLDKNEKIADTDKNIEENIFAL